MNTSHLEDFWRQAFLASLTGTAGSASGAADVIQRATTIADAAAVTLVERERLQGVSALAELYFTRDYTERFPAVQLAEVTAAIKVRDPHASPHARGPDSKGLVLLAKIGKNLPESV